MTEQRHAELERSLGELGQAYRGALRRTDLSSRVIAELQRAPAPRRAPGRPRRLRLAFIVIVALFASASASYAIYELVFDAGPITVHNGPAPSIPVKPITLRLGQQVTLRVAADQQAIVVPTASWLTTKPEVWLDPHHAGQVSMTYAPQRALPEVSSTGVGMLIQEFEADGREVIRKYLNTQTYAEAVAVGSFRGVFLSGGDHTLFYLDRPGHYVVSSGRLVGNALIIEGSGITLRIEADLPRDEMVKLASTLRRWPSD
jgi:hypothetical protein